MEQLIPTLRFPEFSGEWEKKRLGELFAEFKSGTSITSKNIYEFGEYPVFGGNGLRGFTNMYTHDADFFLIGRQGALCGNINSFKGRAFVSEHAIVCIANNKNHTEFLKHKLEYANLNRLSESSAQPGLAVNKLLRLKITIPSLPEQQKIADYLSTIDKKLELLREKREQLECYKKGMMQQLFSQQIRFKDDSGKDYPDWSLLNGNEVFENYSNKKHNGDLPILAVTQDRGAIPREYIDYKVQVTDNSILSYKIVEKGCFIISLRTFQGGIEYSEYKGICSPAYVVLKAFIDIESRFFKYYFKTIDCIKQINSKLEGIRDGKIISYKYFSEIKLPFPSLPEQQKIAEFLSALDTKIEGIANQIEQTEAFKKAMLQQLFV